MQNPSFSTLREFYRSGATRSLEFRRTQLKNLYRTLKEQEGELVEALSADLQRPPMESYMAEIGCLYEETRFALKHLSGWMKPRRVPTPLTGFRSRSKIVPEPKGVVLVLSAWNYPLDLAVGPLIAAIAAGNCVVVKPSEHAPATANAVARLLERAFPPELVQVVQGDAEFTRKLLSPKAGDGFDHILFTGSTQVGRKVMEAAAAHLTPVTLELGGKCPCIVDQYMDLELVARRIVWGKFLNSGQTCVAPDHVIAHENVKNALIDSIRKEIQVNFGPEPLKNRDYARIINAGHFGRLSRYLSEGQVLIGGGTDPASLRIEPTVMDGDTIAKDSAIANDEIFGPILPVYSYRNEEEIYSIVARSPNPLALYVFSRDTEFTNRLLEKIPSGGTCINDTLIHFANPHLPFGGKGTSGMGQYHGRFGFDTFSHLRAVMTKSLWPDLRVRYRPYEKNLPLLKRLM